MCECDVQMWRCADVDRCGQMSRCADVQMCRCADVQMCRCGQMSRCADVQMCRCADVQMWRCVSTIQLRVQKSAPRDFVIDQQIVRGVLELTQCTSWACTDKHKFWSQLNSRTRNMFKTRAGCGCCECKEVLETCSAPTACPNATEQTQKSYITVSDEVVSPLT